MAGDKASTQYELLTRDLVKQLPFAAEVRTTRLDHDARVRGRATTNQIDVLWDFTDAAGHDRRVVFEARSYAKTIDQGKLHAFRSVVDDIQDTQRPVTGVMVTTKGYQRGAKNVAETYGLLILELRGPEPRDFDNRLAAVSVEIVPQFVSITDVTFDAIEVFDEASSGSRHAVEHMQLVQPGRELRDGVDLYATMTSGELASVVHIYRSIVLQDANAAWLTCSVIAYNLSLAAASWPARSWRGQPAPRATALSTTAWRGVASRTCTVQGSGQLQRPMDRWGRQQVLDHVAVDECAAQPLRRCTGTARRSTWSSLTAWAGPARLTTPAGYASRTST